MTAGTGNYGKLVFCTGAAAVVVVILATLAVSSKGNRRAKESNEPPSHGVTSRVNTRGSTERKHDAAREDLAGRAALTAVLKAQRAEARRTTEEADLGATLAVLKELLLKEPGRTLEIARQALLDYPDSEHAPELTWYVVRALWELDRKDESIEEARRMVERYPEDGFAEDVRRHLLNPQMNMTSRAAD